MYMIHSVESQETCQLATIPVNELRVYSFGNAQRIVFEDNIVF